MSKLQAIRFNSSCAICYENYAEGDSLASPDQCGHVFHKECLDNWLKCKHQCPTCRGSIITNTSAPVATPTHRPPPPPARPAPSSLSTRPPPPPVRPAPATFSPPIAIAPQARYVPNIYKTLNLMEALTLFSICQAILKPMEQKISAYSEHYKEILSIIDSLFMVDNGCETAYELQQKIISASITEYRSALLIVSDLLYNAITRHIPRDGFLQNELVRSAYIKVCNIPPIMAFRDKIMS